MMRSRVGERSALHRVQSYAAAADDDYAAPGLDSRGVDDRADAGHHRTADEARPIERHVGPHRHRSRFRHHGVLSEAGRTGHVVDVLPVAVKAHRAVEYGEARRLDPVAEHRPADDAVTAVSAVGAGVEDHVIAGLRPRDVRANLLHHPCAFVLQHDRQGHRPLANHHAIVGVARPGRSHAHEHIAFLRLIELYRFDFEGFVGLVQNRRLHLHGSVSAPCLVGTSPWVRHRPGRPAARRVRLGWIPASIEIRRLISRSREPRHPALYARA